ncbi:MAG: hypothetical protein J3K34DRAFT_433083 [Monoraphidium minutum]|nr:MAG: hypothetical protein J3K34DRAFT_433083 [Monoraphidium minutum]
MGPPAAAPRPAASRWYPFCLFMLSPPWLSGFAFYGPPSPVHATRSHAHARARCMRPSLPRAARRPAAGRPLDP